MPGSFQGLFLNVSGILSKSFILIRVTVCLYRQGEGVGVAVVVVSPLLAQGRCAASSGGQTQTGTGTCHHSLTLLCSATYSQSSPDGGLGKGTHHASPDAFCLVIILVSEKHLVNCNLSVSQQLRAPPPRLKPPLSPPSQLMSERCSVDMAPGLVTGGRVSSTQSVSVHRFC